MIRVVSRRNGQHPGAIYVGRPSPLGNPYEMDSKIDRELAVELHREWLMDVLWGSLRDDQDHVGIRLAFYNIVNILMADCDVMLECWCAPKPCHADTIAMLAEAEVKRIRRTQ